MFLLSAGVHEYVVYEDYNKHI